MCGRFSSSQRLEATGERFEVAVPQNYQHRFNIAPQQRTLIARERANVHERQSSVPTLSSGMSEPTITGPSATG
jgi:putative SOS response-associated peptidase YedK